MGHKKSANSENPSSAVVPYLLQVGPTEGRSPRTDRVFNVSAEAQHCTVGFSTSFYDA